MSASTPRALALGGAFSLLAVLASATFTQPHTPNFRGQPHTQYAYWESFTSANGGANAPTDAQPSTIDANIVQLAPGAILSGGNIYHFQAAPVFVLSGTAPADVREIALQISTYGNELDYAGVELEYLDGAGVPVTVAPTQQVELARYVAMGVNVETLFTWDLNGVTDEIVSYSLHFQGAQPHLSLDAVVLDLSHEVPTSTYCTAKVNSQGCTPAIGWTGGPSVSAGNFTISAANVIANTPGQLFYGLNGRASIPFQGGYLCVALPRHRTPIGFAGGTSGCTGVYSFDFAAHVAAGSDPALLAGALVHTQFWGRDSGALGKSSLSDALEFVLAP